MSPASVKKLISNLWARGVLRVRSVATGFRPRTREGKEALTCPLQHLHVPGLSGSSPGPGPLHRRLQTEGKIQGIEPHRAAASYLPPPQVYRFLRETHSHPAQGLHLVAALGGGIRKPDPCSPSVWGLKRRRRCPSALQWGVDDPLDAPTLPSPAYESAHGSSLTHLQRHCPQPRGEGEAAGDIAEPAGAGHRSPTSRALSGPHGPLSPLRLPLLERGLGTWLRSRSLSLGSFSAGSPVSPLNKLPRVCLALPL